MPHPSQVVDDKHGWLRKSPTLFTWEYYTGSAWIPLPETSILHKLLAEVWKTEVIGDTLQFQFYDGTRMSETEFHNLSRTLAARPRTEAHSGKTLRELLQTAQSEVPTAQAGAVDALVKQILPTVSLDEKPEWWQPGPLGDSAWREYGNLINSGAVGSAGEYLAQVIENVMNGGAGLQATLALARAAGRTLSTQPPWWTDELGPFNPFMRESDINAKLEQVRQLPGIYSKAHAIISAGGPAPDEPVIIDGWHYIRQSDGTLTKVGRVQGPLAAAEVVTKQGIRFIKQPDGKLIEIKEAAVLARVAAGEELSTDNDGNVWAQQADGSFRLAIEAQREAKELTLGGNKFIQDANGRLQLSPTGPSTGELRRDALLTLDQQIDEAVAEGSFDYARALANVRDRPTQLELWQAALDFATSPGDALILQNVQRGLAELEREPGEIGSFPKPALLTQGFADLQTDPFQDQALLQPSPSAATGRESARTSRIQALLSQIEQLETRIAAPAGGGIGSAAPPTATAPDTAFGGFGLRSVEEVTGGPIDLSRLSDVQRQNALAAFERFEAPIEPLLGRNKSRFDLEAIGA